jgi:hypothetical protein
VFIGFSRIFLRGILIFKGLAARRLYKSFGVKELRMTSSKPSLAHLPLPFYIIAPSKPRFGNLTFSVTFPHINPVCQFLLPYMCYAFRSSHSLYYLPLDKNEYFQKIKISLSCSLLNFIYQPVTFFLPGPHISLNTLHLNTASLSFSLNG